MAKYSVGALQRKKLMAGVCPTTTWLHDGLSSGQLPGTETETGGREGGREGAKKVCARGMVGSRKRLKESEGDIRRKGRRYQKEVNEI